MKCKFQNQTFPTWFLHLRSSNMEDEEAWTACLNMSTSWWRSIVDPTQSYSCPLVRISSWTTKRSENFFCTKYSLFDTLLIASISVEIDQTFCCSKNKRRRQQYEISGQYGKEAWLHFEPGYMALFLAMNFQTGLRIQMWRMVKQHPCQSAEFLQLSWFSSTNLMHVCTLKIFEVECQKWPEAHEAPSYASSAPVGPASSSASSSAGPLPATQLNWLDLLSWAWMVPTHICL